MCVCVRVDLPNRSKTCTVSAYHWDCVQRSYQWYGILDLINPSYLHLEMNIAMVIENLLLCLVLLFGSSFPLFKLLLPLMKYGMGIRCTKALSVSTFCSSAWVGGWPPAQGSQIVFWGIVRVSFWYRSFPVTFQKKSSANTYHYSNPCIKQK